MSERGLRSLIRVALAVVVACCVALAGCFSWTEDQDGNLKSVGLPGMPVWKAKEPGPPTGLTDTALTPDQAAKVSGPVLVVPPDQSSALPRYRYYQTGQNTCQQDLAKMISDRAASNSTGPPPYCTGTPTTEAPSASAPTGKGSAFVF
jgi:hypothetical protein